MKKRGAAIGVFDSGFGGLSVLKYLKKALPSYRYVYLGDTARAPYGSRSQESVFKFTKQAVDFLFNKGCVLIVIACNTASAEALPQIQRQHLPSRYARNKRVLGVIVPTLEYVATLPRTERIGLLATEATVYSGAFQRELRKISRHDKIFCQEAPLLVPLVESGEGSRKVREAIVRRYLEPLTDSKIDTLILGCTHYGHLERDIKKIVGKKVRVVSEGPIVARKLKEYLNRHPEIESKLERAGKVDFYTTDLSERFGKLGKLFYGKTMRPKVVHIE